MNIPLTPLRCLRYAEQQYPHRTAVVCGNERFTYEEFAARAARLGGALKNSGVKPGDLATEAARGPRGRRFMTEGVWRA